MSSPVQTAVGSFLPLRGELASDLKVTGEF
jgi:hypothetical protein